MKIQIDSARVASASPLGLLILNYEMILHNLHHAKESLDEKDEEDFQNHLKQAQEALTLLMGSLDMTFDIAKDLMAIYRYTNARIIDARLKTSSNPSCEACDILGSLLDSWRVLKKEEANQAPVMGNVETILAGLTYRDGQLSEYVFGDEDRGILA